MYSFASHRLSWNVELGGTDPRCVGIWIAMLIGYAFTAVLYVIVVAVTSWYKPAAPAEPLPEDSAAAAQVDLGDTDFGPASGHSLLPENERPALLTPFTTSAASTSTAPGLPTIVEPEEAPPTSGGLQGRRKSRFLPTAEEALMLGTVRTPAHTRSFSS